MGCVIDHLQADYRVTVLRDFVDARGAAHRAGEAGLIRAISLDWGRREIEIQWERDGRIEALVFHLDSRTGPGNGRMREYFERGEYEPEASPARGRPEDIVAFEDGPLGRVVRAAVHGDTAEAERLLSRIEDDAASIAEALTAAAVRHSGNRAACAWLAGRAENYWYYWGSQATSGGDGAARMLEMKPALERLRQLQDVDGA